MTNKTFDVALVDVAGAELTHARKNPDRLAAMIERLTHTLAMTIAIGSGGDIAVAGTLSAGAQNYLDEAVADLMPIAKAVGSR